MKNRGFTLIELLVALVVAGILLGFAIPSFKTVMQNYRITSTTNFMMSNLQFARSNAVSSGLAVNLGRKGSTSRNWSSGWTIFTDASSSSGNSTYDATNDTLLRDVGAASTGVDIKVNAAADQWIAFRSNGTLAESGNVVIAICDSRGVSDGRKITVWPTGRPVVTTASSASDPLTSCSP